MLDTLTPLQIGAYGTMGTLTLLSAWRVSGALDALVTLGRQRRLARRLHAALTSGTTADRLSGRAVRALRALEARADEPASAAKLFHAASGGRAPEAAYEAAQLRFEDEIAGLVGLHRHRLARLAAVAGPVGLGCTVLALMVYLLGEDVAHAAAAAAAGSPPPSTGTGLLEALPVSLGTTAIACLNLAILKPAASLLTQRGEETAMAVYAAADAWGARMRNARTVR